MLAAEFLTEPCSFIILSVYSPFTTGSFQTVLFQKDPPFGLISIFNYISLQTSLTFVRPETKLQMEACGPPYFMSHSDSILHREGPATKSLDPGSTYPHPRTPLQRHVVHVSGSGRGTPVTSSTHGKIDPGKDWGSFWKETWFHWQWIPEPRREHIGCGWAPVPLVTWTWVELEGSQTGALSKVQGPVWAPCLSRLKHGTFTARLSWKQCLILFSSVLATPMTFSSPAATPFHWDISVHMSSPVGSQWSFLI